MRHLQLIALTLHPSLLEASPADAPNGIVHAQVGVLFADGDTVYADPAGVQDLEVKDAALGQMARDLFAAVAAKVADSAALPVRVKADPKAPYVQPTAR